MNTTNPNYLIVIIGPTAIGKTALSIEIAKHFNCDILSCDSRQFYKEMAIGTAVPSKEELAAAKHHFIQNISIHDNYSVGDFERESIALLDQLFLKNNIQVMVGGSGLYVDAVLNGLDHFPAIDPAIRIQLNQDLEEKGLAHLQEMLFTLDPKHYQNMAIDNPQRVIRALEVCIGTGKAYSSFLTKGQKKRTFTPIIIGLEAKREIMYDRINLRVDNMIKEGLLEEVKNLLPYQNNNALQTVGYRELFAHFNGEATLDFSIEEIKKNTRRFAKRQITWFKRTESATWFDYKTIPNIIIEHIKSKLS